MFQLLHYQVYAQLDRQIFITKTANVLYEQIVNANILIIYQN